MAQAKSNVERHFPVVMVLEEIDKSLAVLEAKLPAVFKGALRHYSVTMQGKHVNDGGSSYQLKPEAREKLRGQLTPDYAFYEFLRQRIPTLLGIESGARAHRR